MNRKQFFQRSFAGMAALAATSAPFSLTSCAAKKEEKNNVPLNLSFQEGIAPGESLKQKHQGFCYLCRFPRLYLGRRPEGKRIVRHHNA